MNLDTKDPTLNAPIYKKHPVKEIYGIHWVFLDTTKECCELVIAIHHQLGKIYSTLYGGELSIKSLSSL